MDIGNNIQAKLTRGLLDLIILQLLDHNPMHGYQIITKIRKTFGVYLGASTIYPLLKRMEKEGYVKSEWSKNSNRPRKMYSLTGNGQTMLNFNEDSIKLICQKIATQTSTEYDH